MAKASNVFFGFQVFFRLLAVAATLIAAYLIITSKETVIVFTMKFDARYNYSSAYKFFAYANCVACGFSALSLLSVLLIRPGKYFIIFLHDLVMGILLMAACAAATAFGFIGKYGNTHTGWLKICDHFAEYCNKVTKAVASSYVAVILYLILTVMSAYRSRNPPP